MLLRLYLFRLTGLTLHLDLSNQIILSFQIEGSAWRSLAWVADLVTLAQPTLHPLVFLSVSTLSAVGLPPFVAPPFIEDSFAICQRFLAGPLALPFKAWYVFSDFCGSVCYRIGVIPRAATPWGSVAPPLFCPIFEA